MKCKFGGGIEGMKLVLGYGRRGVEEESLGGWGEDLGVCWLVLILFRWVWGWGFSVCVIVCVVWAFF